MEKIKDGGEGNKILANSIREWWVYGVTGPIEKYLINKRVSPDHLTLAGITLTMIGAYLFHSGHFFFGGWVIIFSGVADYLDGRVARATNKVTKTGAFVDSVIDRYSDSIIFLGLMSYYRHSTMFFVVFFGMLGSTAVSYIKARAEALGIECNMGIMQRAERIFYIGVGSFMSGLITINIMPFRDNPKDTPQYLLSLILIWIMILSNYTAISRAKHVIKKIKEKDVASKDSLF